MTKEVKQCMNNGLKESNQEENQQNHDMNDIETKENVECNENIEKEHVKQEETIEIKENAELKEDIGIEEKLKNMEQEKLKKIETQFLDDEEEIKAIKKDFEEWNKKIKDLPEYIKMLRRRLENTIQEFNIKYEEKVKEVGIYKDEKELKLSSSRKKGINMIEKMMENVTKNYLKSLEIKEDLDINSFKIWNDVKELKLEELKKILNENYNIISDLKRKRDSIIKKYFEFISNYILDIVDGIDSGKEISSKQESLEIYKYINDVYDKLYEAFYEELFIKMKISKMQDNIGKTIDLYKNEPFDVEKTTKKEDDEKVYQIVRNGYEYEGKLFNQNQNYIVRPAKVIVYKYEKSVEEDKNEGI